MKMKNKKIVAAACSVLFCLQYAMTATGAIAAEFSNIKTFIMDDDPEKFRHLGSTHYFALDSETPDDDTVEEDPTSEQIPSEDPTDEGSEILPTEPVPDPPPTSPEELIHDKDLNDYTIIEGIDVSRYQPIIDWEAVAAGGIEFVIIRVGYRGYGSEGNLKVDDCFVDHISGATEAGLNIGVYFYTQAITEEEAIEEANLVLEQLEGYELNLPVYIDIESVSNAVGRLDSAQLTPEQHTANCVAFCETIKDAGYEAGIYSNKYWLEEKLDAAYLENKYPIWLARYNKEPEYKGEYQTWQYTCTGTVDGISGEIDRNCLYAKKLEFKDEQLIIKNTGNITPTLYGEGNIQFISSDPNVAEVDNNGVIKPLKNGITTITAYSDEGAKSTLEVIVTAFPMVELSKTSLEFKELGKQIKLTAPKALTKITWVSTAPDVVSVTKDGKIKTVGYGSALIIGTNTRGNIGICEVNVISVIPGDCNNDGIISALDAAELLNYAARSSVNLSEQLDEDAMKRYDANADGKIDTHDAVTILVMSASSSVAS